MEDWQHKPITSHNSHHFLDSSTTRPMLVNVQWLEKVFTCCCDKRQSVSLGFYTTDQHIFLNYKRSDGLICKLFKFNATSFLYPAGGCSVESTCQNKGSFSWKCSEVCWRTSVNKQKTKEQLWQETWSWCSWRSLPQLRDLLTGELGVEVFWSLKSLTYRLDCSWYKRFMFCLKIWETTVGWRGIHVVPLVVKNSSCVSP